jgi:hypothetical protein
VPACAHERNTEQQEKQPLEAIGLKERFAHNRAFYPRNVTKATWQESSSTAIRL